MIKAAPIREKYFFHLTLLLHLLPLILIHPFVTLDGPAHLYNTSLIWQLLSGPGPNCAAFFEFNPLPQPNWGAHFIMLLIYPFIDPLMAEKFVQLLIVWGLGWSFRRLVLCIEPSSVWLSWLIFPFLYNFPFLMGFYNFSLAVVLLLLWLGWWVRRHGESLTWKPAIGAALFLTLMYFSHLVLFLLAGWCAGIISLSSHKILHFKARLRSLLFLLIVCLPGLLLSVLFLSYSGSVGYRGEVAYLPFQILLRDLFTARMLIAYTYLPEREVSTLFAILCISLLVAGLRFRTVQLWQKPLGLICISALLMVFIIPDSVASGGILSVRLIMLFYVFLLLWLSTMRLPQLASRLSAFFATCISLLFINTHYDIQKSLSKEARQFTDAALLFPTDAVVVPLNYSGNWLQANLCCYAGAVRPLVILDNYEATYRNFPLIWKEGMNPEQHLGNNVSSGNPCIRLQGSMQSTGRDIIGVLAWKMGSAEHDSCYSDLQLQLKALGFTSNGTSVENLLIYRRKSAL